MLLMNAFFQHYQHGRQFLLCRKCKVKPVIVKLSPDKRYLVLSRPAGDSRRFKPGRSSCMPCFLHFSTKGLGPQQVHVDSVEIVRGQYSHNFEKCKVLDKVDMSFSICTEEYAFALFSFFN